MELDRRSRLRAVEIAYSKFCVEFSLPFGAANFLFSMTALGFAPRIIPTNVLTSHGPMKSSAARTRKAAAPRLQCGDTSRQKAGMAEIKNTRGKIEAP